MSADAPTPNVQATTDVPLLAGRYQVLDKLGEGGMGAVYRARDAKLDRHVAVKMLPAGTVHDSEAVARFQREGKALARLSHPGIIQAYDNGADGDRHFLVMELVEGHSLARDLTERGRVSPTRTADYGHQAALALNHAHQHGLIHRDVKPSNLLLAADGRVKLLDLGLARFLQDQVGDASLTREGAGMGTPDYAAPEQFRDAHKADPRSDVYSLGCTLYHLIAGRVPFPGSSLSEKVQAHETKEPPPLEELCPDVPGGLALAVQRMMAKRPADRFQNMGEVADALAPYVAGSSASFREMRNTSTWDGSRLATMTARPRRRIRTPWIVASATVLVLLAVGIVGLTAGWFRSGTAQVAHDTGARPPDSEQSSPVVVVGEAKSDDGSRKTAAWDAGDPNVLTVSQKPEGGGAYRTIAAALEKIQPHQTLRIVDDARYHEIVLLNNPRQHQGIILEAPHGAVLETATERSSLITINGVKGVVLRDLRLQAVGTQMCALVTLKRAGPGLMIERVDFAAASGGAYMGVEMTNIPEGKDLATPNVCIASCVFRNAIVGVNVVGAFSSVAGYGAPTPVCGVAVRNNTFIDCQMGMVLRGECHKFQVVANRFRGCQMCAYQLEHVLEATEEVLIANNTAIDCNPALRVWDNQVRTKGVWFRNNLNLQGRYPDNLFLDSAGDPGRPKGPGDASVFLKSWTFDCNWREVTPLVKAPGKPDGWIPPGKGDVVKDKIDGVNREAKSPDFLRPDKDSPLSTAGAGKEEPSLPRYVGALPPVGADPWDWDRARRMPKDAQLSTVSKESSGGGKYRSITEALKDAKPWATIRVLDSGKYEEAIALNDRKKHEGLTLEAVKGATLHMAEGVRRLITIEDVPHVHVTGFTLTDKSSSRDVTRAFVVVSGTAPGVALTRLNLTPNSPMLGFLLQNVVATPAEPLRIEHCAVRPRVLVSNDGISVVGSLDREPASWICLRSNRIFSCLRGVNLHGSLREVHAVGNLIANSSGSAIQLEDLSPSARGLLAANNTAMGGQCVFRVWDNIPYEEPAAGQVEVTNNLFFSADHSDMAYILNPARGGPELLGNGMALLKLWRFHHNRRDFSGASAGFAIPSSPDDALLKRDELLSMSADDLDRVRPGKDSPLATQGAGIRDHSLPAYIGALPREGDPTWDWDRTWRARVKKAEDKK